MFPRALLFVVAAISIGLGAGIWWARRESVAVVGFAAHIWGATNVRVVRDELGALPDPIPVRIVWDSTSQDESAEAAIALAMRLSDVPNLSVVVGHGGSRQSLAAAPIYNDRGIPQIVPSGTDSRLKDVGPWTFMLAPADSVEGVFLVDFAHDSLGASSAALFYTRDEYGTGLRDAILRAAAGRNVTVLDTVGYRGDTHFESLVRASYTRGVPDVVFAASRDRAVAAIGRAWIEVAPTVHILAGDGVERREAWVEELGAASERTYVVTFWHEQRADSVSQAFVKRFARLNGRRPFASEAMRHDALMLAFRAVADAGTSREGIREYLNSLGQTRPPFRGVSGPIAFGADRPNRLLMVSAADGAVVNTASE